MAQTELRAYLPMAAVRALTRSELRDLAVQAIAEAMVRRGHLSRDENTWPFPVEMTLVLEAGRNDLTIQARFDPEARGRHLDKG